MIALMMAAACIPEPTDITLSGQVLIAQDAEQGAPGIGVKAFDSELNEYSTAETDEDGRFATIVQSNRVYHLVLTGIDVNPTAFSGVVGSSDTAIEADELFVRSVSEVDALRSTHDQCTAASNEGGIVEGTVYFRLRNEQDESFLIAEEAMVEVYDANGTQYDTCYLDTDGNSLEAGSEVGATGQFAAFGIPPGAITVVFRQELGASVIENYGFVYMPENGIAPFHPAFIDIAG